MNLITKVYAFCPHCDGHHYWDEKFTATMDIPSSNQSMTCSNCHEGIIITELMTEQTLLTAPNEEEMNKKIEKLYKKHNFKVRRFYEIPEELINNTIDDKILYYLYEEE